MLMTPLVGKDREVARPLVSVTLALMLGLAAAAWGVRLPASWLAAGLGGLWVVALLARLRGWRVLLLPLLLFWLLGLAFYWQTLEPALPAHHLARLAQGSEISLLGRLFLPPQVQEDRVRLWVEAENWLSPRGWRPAAGKLLVRGEGLPPLPEGGRVVMRLRLRPPRDLKNPGAFPWVRYLAGQGIYAEARLRQPGDLVLLAPNRFPSLRERLRAGMRHLLHQLDPKSSRALYLALILGDQGEITPEMRQAFGRTGTSHLLSISGLHLGMLAAISYLGFFWLLRRFPRLLLQINAIKAATVLAAGPVVAYAWVAGGSPATQRAEIMILAYLLLVLMGRPREVPSALALAALIILCLSPLLLFSLSFQLSFLSLAALIYLLPRWLPGLTTERHDPPRPWSRRLWFWVLGALLASLAATLATAPLVAAAFHQVSLLGVLVNLPAIPLMNTLAVPLGLGALAAQGLQLTFLAQGLLYLGKFPLWLGYEIIHMGAALPAAAVILPTPDWLQISCYYGVLLLLLPPRRTYLTWGGAALVGLLLAGTVVYPWLRVPEGLEITCLDSYTGLSGVMVAPGDRRLVFSAGWSSWPGRTSGGVGPLPSYLHWRQFRRLDEVTALRLTSGNAGELLAVAQQFSLGHFWYAGAVSRSPFCVALINLLGDQGRPALSLREGRAPLALGDAALKFFQVSGDKGVALEVTYQGRRVLLLPPLGGLAAGDLPPVAGPSPEVLVISGEVTERLLEALQPRKAVVYGSRQLAPAIGAGGRFPCLFTRDGAVTLTLSATGVTWRQWRPGEVLNFCGRSWE